MGLDVGRDFLAANTTRGPILRVEIGFWPSKVWGEDLMYWPWFTTVDVGFKGVVHVGVCVAEVAPAS